MKFASHGGGEIGELGGVGFVEIFHLFVAQHAIFFEQYINWRIISDAFLSIASMLTRIGQSGLYTCNSFVRIT